MNNSFSPKDRITSLISQLENYSAQIKFNKLGHKINGSTNFDKVEHFTHAVLYGALPDADTLTYIALAFSNYISSKGDIDLDEAFGLYSIQKRGNPAKQAYTKNQKNLVLFEMACYLADNDKTSIEKAAECICSTLGIYEPDSSTYAKYYTNDNWEKVSKILASQNS